jgi:serine/threonine protein kinase
MDLSKLTFDCLLGDDLYTSFKAKLNEKEVVVKFFHECSDENSEFEILEFFQKNSAQPELFPRPYFQLKEYYEELTILETTMEDVYKVIVYQFIDGIVLNKLMELSESEKQQMQKDLTQHLAEIHRLGLVYGDIRIDNLIKDSNNRYLLIDYGRTFGLEFPPMEYMIDNEEIPTQQDDIEALNRIFSQ